MNTPAWPPAFLSTDVTCWPLRRAAAALHGERDFPPVERWDELAWAAGLPEPGVRFERQPPRPRRPRRGASRPGYDESIVEHRAVPSREGSWHDLLNFLVWHTFPRGKAALHRRQLEAQRAEKQGPDLGHARSRERDALALLDEGGVLVGESGGVQRIAPFGHALYERHLLAPRRTCALAVRLTLPDSPELGEHPDAALLSALDEALAAELLRPGSFMDPRDYPRLEL